MHVTKSAIPPHFKLARINEIVGSTPGELVWAYSHSCEPRSSGQYVEGHLKGEKYLKTNWCVENKLFHYYFQDPLLVYRQGLGSPRQVGLKFYIAKDDLRLLLLFLPLPLLGADYRQAPPRPLMQCWEWVHTREASILLTGPSHISDRLTDQTTSEKQPSLSNLSSYFPF